MKILSPLQTLNLPTILDSSLNSSSVFLPLYSSKVWSHSVKPSNSSWLSSSSG